MQPYLITVSFCALATLTTAQAQVSASDITLEHNFATLLLNSETPVVDMGEFGDPSGQLPKVYDLRRPDGMVYNPEASYQEFLQVVNGTKSGLRHRDELNAERNAARKRQVEQFITFEIEGANVQTKYFDNFVCGNNPGAGCQSPENRPYTRIIVRANDNCYFTFWKSGRCDKKSGRFAPSCRSDELQTCSLNFDPSSFAVFNTCDTGNPSTGCSES